MDWGPWLLLGGSAVLTTAGFLFVRTMNTLSAHTITLTRLVEQLRPLDKIVNEIIDLKVEQAELKTQVANNTTKLAQTIN